VTSARLPASRERPPARPESSLFTAMSSLESIWKRQPILTVVPSAERDLGAVFY
jgi:hypothetical protein